MKRPWLSSTMKRSGDGWRCTYFDLEREPIVSVWHEDRVLAVKGAAKHVERLGTPKEAGE